MRLTKAEVRSVWESDRKVEKGRERTAVIVFIAVFLLCMCFRYRAYLYDEKIVPLQNFKSILIGIKYTIVRLVSPVVYAHKEEAIEAIGRELYLGAFGRLKITAMAAVAGAGCSMAGAIFQTIFKNPMAGPGMLGATAGVRLGNILMISLYSVQALEMITRRYVYCYAFAAGCVVLVILLGKAAGDRKGNPSVMKMIMAGSVISQGLNVFAMYYMYELTDEDLVLYEELTMGTNVATDWLSLLIFFGAMGIAIIPMLLVRYKFNAVSMDYVEVRTGGVDPGPLRLLGEICGVIMITSAMIHNGDTGMIGMIIPYTVRQRVGADTRKVLFYSAVSGAVLMMLCRLLSSMFIFEDAEIPVGFIINLLMMPAMMYVMTRRRRGFIE